MTDHVRSDISNGVLTMTLNRPEKKNALTRDMYQALADGIDGAGHNPDVRCVLIQAEGDTFTAGNDLGDFAAANRGEPDAVRSGGNPLLAALARATTPLVAAVNGRAVGVGTTALHCDLVFVSDDALLTTPFVNPGAGSSGIQPTCLRIGHARAFSMFVLGEAVDAKMAVDWGIANAACPAGELRERARAAAEAVAARPASAVTITKALMRDPAALAARMEVEGVHFAAQLKSADAREAFAAFAGKRAPRQSPS
jgi:enoyl-CoA hydratase/carnithine racemase